MFNIQPATLSGKYSSSMQRVTRGYILSLCGRITCKPFEITDAFCTVILDVAILSAVDESTATAMINMRIPEYKEKKVDQKRKTKKASYRFHILRQGR